MTRSGRLKSYWSGVTNVKDRAQANNKGGEAVRKKLFEETKDKIFTESNFKKWNDGKKGGKAIKKTDIRKALKKIKVRKSKELKKDWKELKKEGRNVGSFKEFEKANLKDDQEWQDIRELFNSP